MSPVEILAQYSMENDVVEGPEYAKLKNLAEKDVEVICNAPPGPNVWMPILDYEFPVDILLAGEDLLFNSTGGPSACQPVACEKSSGGAIYFCNDNPDPIIVLFVDMGVLAAKIYSQCPKQEPSGAEINKGQAFSPDNWNVFFGSIDPCTMESGKK
ncbi:Uu.00g062040.m01.CDS01 [Anthostomella pinea]|uniref:Uu.00g062040.m01.CDS01 n=1 Tax=Anthostomella pinea TaxID=933095 RepID=A0AAI8YMR4_9PEZI|nr:Uu.00g062040.m01.CDS01 [Anthostomella pinea]